MLLSKRTTLIPPKWSDQTAVTIGEHSFEEFSFNMQELCRADLTKIICFSQNREDNSLSIKLLHCIL